MDVDEVEGEREEGDERRRNGVLELLCPAFR